MAEDIQKLKYRIDYQFQDMTLLKRALTHRSYASENNLDYDNQRLEFLGDAVLEIVLTDCLFKRYPEEPEGCLTKMRAAMVQKDALNQLASAIGLSDFILLGRGEIESAGATRPSTQADAFEALLGALYLDNGLEAASSFLLPLIDKTFPNPISLIKQVNPKGMLQEYVQKTNGRPPDYITVDVNGPAHDPIYHVKVTTHCGISTIGTGVNRKAAEFSAAKKALAELSKTDPELEKIFGPDTDEGQS
jgi:ribonuclease III